MTGRVAAILFDTEVNSANLHLHTIADGIYVIGAVESSG